MKRLFSFLGWSALFLVICAGFDQLLVRVEMQQPVLAEIQTFYVDFRSRLVRLSQAVGLGEPRGGKKMASPRQQKNATALPKAKATPSSLPRERKVEPAASIATSAAEESYPRYLYVDGKGALLFADDLEDIPPALRKGARPLSP